MKHKLYIRFSIHRAISELRVILRWNFNRPNGHGRICDCYLFYAILCIYNSFWIFVFSFLIRCNPHIHYIIRIGSVSIGSLAVWIAIFIAVKIDCENVGKHRTFMMWKYFMLCWWIELWLSFCIAICRGCDLIR